MTRDPGKRPENDDRTVGQGPAEPDLGEYTRQYLAFLDEFDSTYIATVDTDGEPEASYAPCIRVDGIIYVFISELSQHTKNLLNNGKVSLLFIEAEHAAAHLFARRRVNYRARAVEVERGSDEFKARLDAFEAKFGKFMTMLRGLADFHLFRLMPSSGTYVAGFGRAFTLQGEKLEQLVHVNPATATDDVDSGSGVKAQ